MQKINGLPAGHLLETLKQKKKQNQLLDFTQAKRK